MTERPTTYILTSPELLFSVALALHEADVIDASRGIVSGISGPVAWVAIQRNAYILATEVTVDIDPGVLLCSAIDYIGEAVEAMA